MDMLSNSKPSTEPYFFSPSWFLEQIIFSWCFVEAEEVGKRSGREQGQMYAEAGCIW